MAADARTQLFTALAELLAYPRRDTGALARRAAALAGGEGTADALLRFAGAAEALGGAGLEELYTATFDLEPACAPYLGAQLLGDDPLRGRFLARLVELYGAERFTPREELADHVAEVLAFLAGARPSEDRDALVQDALLPALERMIAALGERPHPYRDLLVAARSLAGPVGLPAAAGTAEVPA